MIRNRHLRAEAERAILRDHKDGAIAALLLAASTDKQIADVTGIPAQTVRNRMTFMKRRAGVTNRVGLALALRELV
jgi:DNA-binding NarL/FixJ family response regulator